MPLQTYRKKRNFNRTKEPYGKIEKKSSGLYVIQEHAASHLHYDLRLELEGVLKSWAVPKGPSLDSEIKRLAVHVEDHPIAYGSFEGRIPKGEYGAGVVLLWDRGRWSNEGLAAKAAYKKGHLSFILKGKKLKGLWHLVQLKNDPKNWLFFKGKDKYEKSESEYNVLLKKPKSVKSQLTLQSLTKHYEKQMNKSGVIASKKKIIKMPTNIHPELATLIDDAPIDNSWLNEIKYDGYRIISFIKDKKIKLMTRNQKDWTKKFPVIESALKKLQLKLTILDGELVALDKKGRSNFQLLQESIQKNQAQNLIYYVFDLIYYDGNDYTHYALEERKKQLSEILAKKSSCIIYSDHIVGNGDKLYKKACKLGLEGIIAKKALSHYVQKRSRDWLKVKCSKRQEFIVVGFTKPKSSRKYFGSLLLAVYNKNKKLQYSGHVGTGFTAMTLKNMAEKLNHYKTKSAPLRVPSMIAKQVTWIKPKIVVEVAFTEWTREGVLRHPSFKGIRLDKPASKVIKEKSKNLF